MNLQEIMDHAVEHDLDTDKILDLWNNDRDELIRMYKNRDNRVSHDISVGDFLGSLYESFTIDGETSSWGKYVKQEDPEGPPEHMGQYDGERINKNGSTWVWNKSFWSSNGTWVKLNNK